jgi:hypothetical protein
MRYALRLTTDVKVDFCGFKTGPTEGPLVSIDPKPQYKAWEALGAALDRSGRRMWFSICPHAPAAEPMDWMPPPPGINVTMYSPPPQWTKQQRHALGGKNGNSLLVEYGNSIDGWDGCDSCGNTSVLKHVGLIHGIDAGIAATNLSYGTRGSFNDVSCTLPSWPDVLYNYLLCCTASDMPTMPVPTVPASTVPASTVPPSTMPQMDMMQVCNFGEGRTGKRWGGMTINEYRVQYSVWAILASNLILGVDLRTIKQRHPECLELLMNMDIIAGDHIFL